MKPHETLKQKLESHIAFLSAGRSEEVSRQIRAAFEDIVGATCDEMTGKTADSMYFPHTYKGINARIEEEKLTKKRLLEEIK
jgi:hypothetical protein